MAVAACVDLDQDAAGLGLQLLRLADDVLDAVNHALAAFGLTASKLHVLLLFLSHEAAGRDDDPPQPSTIAERLGIQRQSVTGLLDWLEQRGLIARQDHPTDRRARVIALTTAGRRLIDDVLPSYWAACAALTAGLSVEERDVLRTVLPKLLAARQSARRGSRIGAHAHRGPRSHDVERGDTP